MPPMTKSNYKNRPILPSGTVRHVSGIRPARYFPRPARPARFLQLLLKNRIESNRGGKDAGEGRTDYYKSFSKNRAGRAGRCRTGPFPCRTGAGRRAFPAGREGYTRKSIPSAKAGCSCFVNVNYRRILWGSASLKSIPALDTLMTETFLAHAVKDMKKHYAERHFKLLDEALGVMEGVVRLPFNAPPSNQHPYDA